MTDGERLVWASSYALALDRGVDASVAVRTAARAVVQLREAALRLSDGHFPTAVVDEIAEVDERRFLDEIVNSP